MQLSNSGRIIIIDDNHEEVWPLIEALGKNQVPFIYLDGTLENLPEKQFQGVRFVFLDIELQGMEGLNSKSKASALAGLLKKLISPSNGPYVIVFWTKHMEVIELVLEHCSSIAIPPVASVDLEENECMRTEGSSRIQTITDKLEEKLAHIGAFPLYAAWEDAVHDAATAFTAEISSLVPAGKDTTKWSNNTAALFREMHEACRLLQICEK